MPLGVHLLGRKAPVNPYHYLAKYSLEVPPPEAGTVEVEIKRPTASNYDQGQTPKCVAYSFSKVVNWFNKEAFYAPWLYDECKKIDGFPNEDGTNADSASRVLKAQGHARMIKGKEQAPAKSHGISSYAWARSSNDVRAIFSAAKPQPVLIGMDWYNAWFDPAHRGKDYWLDQSALAAGPVGGHEIGIWAVSDARQAVGFSNTWGNDWTGADDIVWMPYSLFDYQLSQGADACVITDLATR